MALGILDLVSRDVWAIVRRFCLLVRIPVYLLMRLSSSVFDTTATALFVCLHASLFLGFRTSKGENGTLVGSFCCPSVCEDPISQEYFDVSS